LRAYITAGTTETKRSMKETTKEISNANTSTAAILEQRKKALGIDTPKAGEGDGKADADAEPGLDFTPSKAGNGISVMARLTGRADIDEKVKAYVPEYPEHILPYINPSSGKPCKVAVEVATIKWLHVAHPKANYWAHNKDQRGALKEVCKKQRDYQTNYEWAQKFILEVSHHVENKMRAVNLKLAKDKSFKISSYSFRQNKTGSINRGVTVYVRRDEAALLAQRQLQGKRARKAAKARAKANGKG